MKISYNWLKEYAKIDLVPEEVSALLTDCGLEVEGLEVVESVRGGLKGLVIGEVLTCTKHPDADRLNLTTVNIGEAEILPIVCGASNIAAGQKVVVASVGTVLYSGEECFTIKKSKIRGQESCGMICAEDEIGLGISHEGILVLPADVKVGMSAADYFKVESDIVFEIGLTPNRSDATCHLGVARDLVAVLNVRKNFDLRLNYPDINEFSIKDISAPLQIKVEDNERCPRYTGLNICGIRVADSPQWLQNRLKAVGMRPINNVVDVTNYVMMEMGQPLHAFDADLVKGRIIVRTAKDGELFITLDGVERKLSSSDLMICNADEPMCIAGVFGGEKSGVKAQTTAIFLESAYFNPVSTRKTARRHGLHTDASFRYERGADPQITPYALKRAALLICEICGGHVCSDIVDIYPQSIGCKEVKVEYQHVCDFAGQKIEIEEIHHILTCLEMVVKPHDTESCMVCVPSNKADVYREIDLIEEILRIYGFNRIALSGKVNFAWNYSSGQSTEVVQNKIADFLTDQGFYEIMNNSLTKIEYAEKYFGIPIEQIVSIANPLSNELNVMRSSLLGGALESIAYNCHHKNFDLKFYEFGRIYAKEEKSYKENFRLGIWITGHTQEENWEIPLKKANFFFLKGYVNSIVEYLRLTSLKWKETPISDMMFTEGLSYAVNGKEIVRFGKIKASLAKQFDIKQDIFCADFDWDAVWALMPKSPLKSKEISKYPEVRRDLALLLDKNISFESLEKCAFQAEKALLKSVNLFDVYQGDKLPEGKKSYALSFVLQDDRSTLTDKQIEKTMEKLQKSFTDQFGAELR